MKVIQQYSDSTFLDTAEVTTQQFQKSTYNISADVIEFVRSKLYVGNTAVLFSGHWRFNFDAIYLEAKIFKHNTIVAREKKTYFVEPSDEKLFDKIMYDIEASNILILHSAVFCNYQPMDKIIDKMKNYQKFNPKQIVLTVPHGKIDFNRLKYSVNDIAQQYQIEIVDDSFIVQLSLI
jgi:hypothetical protein